MRPKRLLIAGIGIVCLLGLLSACGRSAPALPAVSATPAQNPDTEVAVLQAQLDEMRRSDDQLVTTVYWALGGILTIAAVIIGFNLLIGWRNYDRDKASMERGLTLDLAQGIDELTKITQDSERKVFGEMRSLEERLLSQVRAEIGQIRANLPAEIDSRVQSEVTLNSKELERRIAVQEYAYSVGQYYQNMSMGDYGQAVYSATVMLTAAIDMDVPSITSSALDRLGEALSQVDALPPFLSYRLGIELSRGFPSDGDERVQKIRNRLSELPNKN